jgi:hypothetical protein
MQINPSTQCEEMFSEYSETFWKYSCFINRGLAASTARGRSTLNIVDYEQLWAGISTRPLKAYRWTPRIGNLVPELRG